MGMDKLKGFFGNKNDDEEKIEVEANENEFYDAKETFSDSSKDSKMILVEPRAYSESQQIADYLKGRSSVVVVLKRVTPDQAKRIVDFLYGTIYAIGGSIQKLGGGIFLCTPNNVNVEGNISDDNQQATKSASKKKDTKEEDEEDFF